MMQKKDVINAINILRKYDSETNRIEAKSALGGFLKNVMIHFLAFLINMVVLLYLD